MRDRVENAAHGLRRNRHAADAVAEDRRHGREQHRRALDRDPRVREPEAVDPRDLGKEPDDLAERQQNADHQDADDERVERRIGAEGDPDLLVENDDDQAAKDQEHQHPEQKDPGRCELEGIEVFRHGRPFIAESLERDDFLRIVIPLISLFGMILSENRLRPASHNFGLMLQSISGGPLPPKMHSLHRISPQYGSL